MAFKIMDSFKGTAKEAVASVKTAMSEADKQELAAKKAEQTRQRIEQKRRFLAAYNRYYECLIRERVFSDDTYMGICLTQGIQDTFRVIITKEGARKDLYQIESTQQGFLSYLQERRQKDELLLNNKNVDFQRLQAREDILCRSYESQYIRLQNAPTMDDQSRLLGNMDNKAFDYMNCEADMAGLEREAMYIRNEIITIDSMLKSGFKVHLNNSNTRDWIVSVY